MKALRKIAVAGGALLVSLVLVEGVLRFTYGPRDVLCGWRSRVSRFELNQLGFRGQPIEYAGDDFVIVLLGDSHVESTACAYGWMPERRLEYHLNARLPARRCKVFTVGTLGYGQDQELLALREYYEPYRADLVVLWQTLKNDVWNNVFPTHWPANGTPKPTFRLVDGRRVGPNLPMGQNLTYHTPVRLLDLLCNTLLVPRNLDGRWEEYLPPAYTPILEHHGPVNTHWQHRWDIELGPMRQENLATEKSHLAVHLSPRSPRMQYGIDLTHSLLSEIRDLVEAHSGQFLLFSSESHPAPWEEEAGVQALNGKFYRVSTDQYRANRESVNAGFRVVDVPITVSDWKVGPANSHLNEHAVDQVMHDLAERLAAEMTTQKGREIGER